MTLPDIETFHLKRSVHNVEYLYIFHSMGSTHAIYREQAFDNYDVIFTIGPHHEKEIRKREVMLDLPKKTLIPHGNGRLDNLIQQAAKQKSKSTNKKPHILVAPSWGPSSITNRCAVPLVKELLNAGLKVTYRPHPMSQRQAVDKLNEIQTIFKEYEDFLYETDIRFSESLQESDALITEWSGIAFEYSFTYGKPVYSIDTPRKVNNENYKQLGLETLEDKIRHEIGTVIAEDNLSAVVGEIKRDFKNKKQFSEKTKKLRDKWVYNVGKSAKVAADNIEKRITENAT